MPRLRNKLGCVSSSEGQQHRMGIQDRDYMRRPPEDNEPESSVDSRLEEFLGGFFRRHPRLPWVIGITLVALLVAALLIAKLSGATH